jgi:hypothetical protein
MSLQRSSEARLLSAAERDDVELTHYPRLLDLSPHELQALIRRLRAQRDRAQTIGRQQRREMRGKSDVRGAAPARDNRGTIGKAQVLAQALKRANKERARLGDHELPAEGPHDAAPVAVDAPGPDAAASSPAEPVVHATQAELSLKALRMRQAARAARHPSAGNTASTGMHDHPSHERTVRMDPREIGRVSQATRVAQAHRDAANRHDG